MASVGAEDDVTALATVAAVRSAFGNKFFPPKADAARAAMPGFYKYFCFVNKLHSHPK